MKAVVQERREFFPIQNRCCYPRSILPWSAEFATTATTAGRINKKCAGIRSVVKQLTEVMQRFPEFASMFAVVRNNDALVARVEKQDPEWRLCVGATLNQVTIRHQSNGMLGPPRVASTMFANNRDKNIVTKLKYPPGLSNDFFTVVAQQIVWKNAFESKSTEYPPTQILNLRGTNREVIATGLQQPTTFEHQIEQTVT